MTSSIIPRSATIATLAACAVLGAYGTFVAGIKNGLFDSITKSAGQKVHDKYFPGGPAPYKTTYTGFDVIDGHLIILIAFFTYIIDGPKTWDVVLVYWYLMSQFCAGWTLLSLEGLRKGNKGRVVSWTGVMGFILQTFTFTITVPVYLIMHLITSPMSTAEVSSQAILVDTSDSAILPLSTTLSFVIPSVMMYLSAPAKVSASTHYTWQAIWQVFPVMQSIYHWILRSILPGPSSRSSSSTRAHIVGVYRYILFLCFVPQILLLTVAVTPATVVPDVLKPMFQDVDLVSAFIPYWPWNSPTANELAGAAAGLASATVVTADGKADLVKLFLQWDVYCGGAAILTWAVFIYGVARPEKSVIGSIVPKAVFWMVLGGPVGAAAMLLLERDAAAIGDAAERKKRH
ncbi:hypothetical protein VM1G_04663 [Cytospora mali]|uniref:Uncharacterized protein n=1 Tax=Cytospora mali TaxID=578113 RepID=A0A194VW76_CYTMA|nr:hypothetical protein VM1G_04663 [Valsa mali]